MRHRLGNWASTVDLVGDRFRWTQYRPNLAGAGVPRIQPDVCWQPHWWHLGILRRPYRRSDLRLALRLRRSARDGATSNGGLIPYSRARARRCTIARVMSRGYDVVEFACVDGAVVQRPDNDLRQPWRESARVTLGWSGRLGLFLFAGSEQRTLFPKQAT